MGNPLQFTWSHFDNDAEKKVPLDGERGFTLPKDALGVGTKFYAPEISRSGDAKRTITAYAVSRRAG